MAGRSEALGDLAERVGPSSPLEPERPDSGRVECDTGGDPGSSHPTGFLTSSAGVSVEGVRSVHRARMGCVARVLQQLRDIVGPGHLIVEPGRDGVVRHRLDRALSSVTRRPSSGPATAGEVAAVVCVCRDAGVALVPQGGNTGLVGRKRPSRTARSCSVCGGWPGSAMSTRWAASSPPAPGRRWPTSRRPRPRPDGRTASISAAVTARRSGAPSPPTPVGSRCSAMAPRGRNSWAVRPCSGPARPSRTWAGS